MKRYLILVLAVACSRSGDDPEVVHRVPVSIQEVRQDSIAETLDLVGRLTPPPGGEATLTAPADGVVRNIAVQVGQQVGRGQHLLTVDAPDLQAQARSARAQAVAAKQNVERQRELFQAGVSSRKQLEEADAAATAAEAAADAAESLLSRTNVTAPIGGAVQSITVNAGERVASGAPLIQVVNGKVLTIIATVPTPALARLHAGMPATISVEGAADTAEGLVQGISPAVDTITNSGTVVITLRRRPPGFRPGAGATARVVVSIHPNALLVSDSSVVVLGATPTVFVVQPDSTVKAIPVEVRLRSGGLVEVTGDLKPGDRVVATGAYGLSDGMHVMPGQGEPGTTPVADSAKSP
ncbi:MAG: efflux RND transporter periplasmic adaptor subunit [Gemmatimonadota bacterium]